MTARIPSAQISINQASEGARRYELSAGLLANQLAAVEKLDPTPTNKREVSRLRRLHAQHHDRALAYQAMEKDFTS